MSARRSIAVLASATFLLAFAEGLWLRYMPRYLDALGAGALVVGLWGTLGDGLEAAWQYPGGALADRWGRKATLLALTALSLVGLALFLAPSWPVVLAGLLFYTASTAYAQPATFAVIADALPRERRARGFVLQSVLKRGPLLVAPPLGGFLISERLGVLGGVRASLLLALALFAVALAVQARWFPRGTRAPPRPSLGWGALPPPLRRLLLSDILVRAGEHGSKAFIVLYVVTVLGYSDLDFGLLLALQTLVSLAVYWPAARAADRGRRKPWVGLTFAFFALFPVALLAGRTLPLLLLAFVIAGLKEVGEPARKAAITELAPEAHKGRAVGAYYAVRGLAVAPFGVLGGLLWLRSPDLLLIGAAVVSALGLGLYVFSVREEPRAQ